jgi:hypothetical protein
LFCFLVAHRVPLKTQIWGNFWPLENQGLFRGIFKVSYKRAFSVKYCKNYEDFSVRKLVPPYF